MNHYILTDLDIIRQGDEFITPDDFTWQPVTPYLVGKSKRRAEVLTKKFMEVRRQARCAIAG